jgi:hypothetical protein
MKFEPNLPETFGYYWVIKKKSENPELKYFTHSKNYKVDERSVETWDCPGIGRTYLDLQKMPRWMWIPIDKPEYHD